METKTYTEHHESYTNEDLDSGPANINSRLINPFIGKRQEEMNDLIDSFMRITGIEDFNTEVIRKGAFLAQDPQAFSHPRTDDLALKPDEVETLRLEDPKTGNKVSTIGRVFPGVHVNPISVEPTVETLRVGRLLLAWGCCAGLGRNRGQWSAR